MIDTIKIHKETFEALSVLEFLESVKEYTNPKRYGSQVQYKGEYKNFRVNVNSCNIWIEGSLAKYYLPSNVYTLTRKDIEKAVQQLSEELQMNIKEFTVYRLDISTILKVNEDPSKYYDVLGDLPRFYRVREKNSLYYNTTRKKLLFYDKVKEATGKGANIHQAIKEDYLLRYELRYLRETQKQLREVLGLSEKDKQPITVELLYNPTNYTRIIRKWGEEFTKIRTLKFIGMKETYTPKEAKDLLVMTLLESENGKEKIDVFIEQLKASNKLKSPKDYTRLKNELNRLANQQPQQNDLIKELQEKIQQVVKFAR